MIALLLGRVQVWIGAVVAAVGIVLAVFLAGRREGRKAAEDRALGRALDQRVAGDEASARYRGAGGARERLRDGTF
jgi:hypothetical protein